MARPARDDEAPAPPAAELPPEVLERLSRHGRVRLTVGDDPGGVEATVAPLGGQLFLLVARGGATEERLLEESRAVLSAEDKGGEWSVRATGRAVPGRPVPAEPRRPELMHWLPEGVSPSGLVAVRFHPETVDYSRGRGTARTRAHGPVPGGAAPGVAGRWSMLATDGVVLLYFLLAALDWVGLLVLVEEAQRTMVLLAVLVGAGVALVAGVQLLHQAAVFTRWRDGQESDARARLVTSGWVGPRRVQRAGFAMLAVGLLLAALVAAGAGWRVAGYAVLASGAPFLGVVHAARHLLRRGDAEEERR